jgi:hypothetical protein
MSNTKGLVQRFAAGNVLSVRKKLHRSFGGKVRRLRMTKVLEKWTT